MADPAADDLSDEEMLAELGATIVAKGRAKYTPREERVIAGFEDIVKFVDEHGRPPAHGEGLDIFERLYAVRLDRLRTLTEYHMLLAPFDKHDLIDPLRAGGVEEDLDDDALLAELGVSRTAPDDITVLRHVKSQVEIKAAEEIASRARCPDFETFKPLFDQVKADLAAGVRKTRPYERMAEIQKGEFFIVGGQTAYIAHVGDDLENYDRRNCRLRIVWDNETESDNLLRSFQRALYKDNAGRRITSPSAGPLFGDTADETDAAAGTIYVLRSRSNDPYVAAHRDTIHKIGVTGGKVETRIANAANDATYLLAPVDVIATYKLFNLNAGKLEAIFHRVFAAAQIDLTIPDRFGRPVKPREWFQVPLDVIDEAVARVRDGSIADVSYNPSSGALEARV